MQRAPRNEACRSLSGLPGCDRGRQIVDATRAQAEGEAELRTWPARALARNRTLKCLFE